MKPGLIFLLLFLTFYSCNIIKKYRSSENINQHPSKSNNQLCKMITSGKTIEFRNGITHEILFFGDENLPRESPFNKNFQKKNYKFSEPNLIFFHSGGDEKLKIITSHPSSHLILINGEFQEDFKFLKDIDLKTIKSINVIESDAAIKKFGEKGYNGIIEIILRKTES